MNEPTTTRNTVQPHIALTIIIASIAANVVLGTIVRHATLPVYLDTVGTISMAILLRWRWALLGSLLGVIVGTLVIFPLYFYFSLTAVGIVCAVEFCRRHNWFRSIYTTVL